MSTVKEKLLAYLNSDTGVLRQIQCYLLLLRIYEPTEREYRQKYAPIERDYHYKGFKLPKYPKLFRVYNVSSNILMGWIFFKYLTPRPFAELGKLLYSTFIDEGPELPAHCYVFGRIVIHYQIAEELFGFMLASFHLSWRLAQWMLDRPHLLNVVVFLLQPEADIRRFLAKFNSSASYARQTAPIGSTGEPDVSLTKFYGQANNGKAQLSSHELFLRNVLCCKITYAAEMDECKRHQHHHRHTGRILYRLRPNRTPEAHRKLVQWLSNTTTLSVLGLLSLAFIIASYMTFIILFNRFRYQSAYPDCDQQVARAYRDGTLPRWSTHFGSHHLATLTFDGFENFILWWESGLSLLFLLMFSNYLNQDLLIYWTHLNVKIRRMLAESRQLYCVSNYHHRLAYRDEDSNSMIVFVTSLTEEVQQEIYHLQAELGDFFRQINEVDQLISDIISHALVIWLTCFGAFSNKGAEMYSANGNTGYGLVLQGTLLAAFSGFSATSISLLSLQRRCKLSYRSLCSLMAYDQSRYKAHFTEIIKFYTTRNHTCYTLFHQYPFSSATFVSIIGWSITGFLVLDNISHR